MKITILQNKLKEALNIVGRATSKSLTLPILKNILIKAEDNFINISATDLEIAIKWWILTKTDKIGEITVPFSVFSGFINLLPEEKIDINVKNNTLSVECSDYKTQINGLSSNDFPIIPKIEKKGSVIINSKILCNGLSQIIDIPSLSKVKPEISGIFLLFSNKEVKIVATDSYRLSEKTIKLKEKTNQNFSFIIPQKTAREVINIFKEEDVDVNIIFGSNQVIFESKMQETNHLKVQLFSKLIEGEYPDYKNIIPQNSDTKIILDRSDFLNKIKAASVFSGKVNEVSLNVDAKKGEVIIKSESPDLGDYKSTISANIEGDNTKISFNHKFLADGVDNIKSSQLLLEINKESNPGLIKPIGKDDFLYVVMPIKNN